VRGNGSSAINHRKGKRPVMRKIMGGPVIVGQKGTAKTRSTTWKAAQQKKKKDKGGADKRMTRGGQPPRNFQQQKEGKRGLGVRGEESHSNRPRTSTLIKTSQGGNPTGERGTEKANSRRGRLPSLPVARKKDYKGSQRRAHRFIRIRTGGEESSKKKKNSWQ